MANHCDFYEYKSSFFSGGHWCVLKDKEISSDVYKQFCEYASSAKKLSVQKKRQFVRLFFDNRMCSGEKFTG